MRLCAGPRRAPAVNAHFETKTCGWPGARLAIRFLVPPGREPQSHPGALPFFVEGLHVWYNRDMAIDWPAHEQGVEMMVADRSHLSDGLYMTEDQYLALDDATDGKYERLNGMVTMLRPPSSLEGADESILDMAGGSDAHAALCSRLTLLIGA